MLQAFVTSALDEGEWFTSQPIPIEWVFVGPRAGLDVVSSAGNLTPVVQTIYSPLICPGSWISI